MRTNVEYMLAVRTARHDRGSRAAVMMRIASLSTALGIAVMILTLAVVAGFRHEISDDLRGLAGDIQVIDVSGWGRSDSDPMPQSDSLLERLRRSEHVLSVAPYAVAGCMVKSGDRVAGLRFKGVGDGFDEAWWRAKLVEGELPDVRSAERRKELLISRATARSLRVGVGDKIEALFLDEGDAPHRDRYKVAGIYHTGFEELDGVMAVADLRDVRKSASWGDDEITGYEIALDDPSRADAAAERIDALLEEAFYDGDEIAGECVAATLEMRYPVIYDWLKAHGVNARVIIFIMTVVALFNMASAMLIMVLDRTGMIGTLKAAGMRNAAIRRIFLWRAAMLFVRGAAWGNAVGLGLAAAQAVFCPVTLNPSGYMLSALPVRVELWWWAALNAGALAVTVAAMWLPSMIVARISPEESLKYKQ